MESAENVRPVPVSGIAGPKIVLGLHATRPVAPQAHLGRLCGVGRRSAGTESTYPDDVGMWREAPLAPFRAETANAATVCGEAGMSCCPKTRTETVSGEVGLSCFFFNTAEFNQMRVAAWATRAEGPGS